MPRFVLIVNETSAVNFAQGDMMMAGAAGLLLANTFFVSPTDGTNYIIKAYIAVLVILSVRPPGIFCELVHCRV